MKTTIITFVILIILIPIFYLNIKGFYPNYSDGTRSGEVYKFSKKGIFYKSWEGEMYLGYVSNQSSKGQIQANVWYFSIPDNANQETINAIQNCVNIRKVDCSINYKQWLIGPIYQDSAYTAQSVNY